MVLAVALFGGTRAQDAPASSAAEEAPSTRPPRTVIFPETNSGRKPLWIAINTKVETKDARAKEILAKLQSIVIPRVEFREITLKGAIDFMEKEAFERDTRETDPAKRGVKFFIKLDGISPAPARPGGPFSIQSADARITISLTDVPVLEVLKYVTSLANMKFRVSGNGVLIVPLVYGGEIETRTWDLSRTAYESLPFASDADA
jgi:general secretion pathway protein D